MCVWSFFCKNPDLGGKRLTVEFPKMTGNSSRGTAHMKMGQEKKQMRKRKEAAHSPENLVTRA